MIPLPINILLVDDDKVDVMAVKRALRDLAIENPVQVAENGLEALDWLRGDNGRAKLGARCLVLLDLNMPRMGGLEFLTEIRRDPALRRTLVFVMTTSAAEEDRARAYDRNIAGYIIKQRFGQSFLDTVSMLKNYWQVIAFPA